MKPANPIAIAFREVRHFGPDDCLHCEAIEVRGRLHDWTIPAHRHEGLHQFQWLERGRASVSIDNQAHEIEAPAVLMVAPGSVHAFEYERGCAGCQVTVPTSMLQRAFADAPALAARLAPSQLLTAGALEGQAQRTHDLFTALAAEFDRSGLGRMAALQAHVVLLATWVLRQTAPTGAEESRQALRDTLVQRYRALLEIHLRQRQPLGFFAERLKVTPDHLSRACRAAVGLSALDLMHERMVVEAGRLLGSTDAGVAEVAHELGFADPAHFSRFFARRAGLSPQAYRSAMLNGKAVQP